MKTPFIRRCLSILLGVLCVLPAFAQSPAIPEEARKYFVRGETLIKDPKATPDDALQAAKEFVEAARLAPSWPEARRNAAVAFEIAGDYASAIAHLKLYQSFKLSETDARTVQDKLYALEVKQEKAAKDKESAAKKAAEEAREAERKAREEREAAAKKVDPQEEFLKKIEGARFSREDKCGDVETVQGTIEIHGTTAILTSKLIWQSAEMERLNPGRVARARHEEVGRGEIRGQEFTLPGTLWNGKKYQQRYVISDDGYTIKAPFEGHETIYRRER